MRRLFSTIVHKSNATYGAMFKGFVLNKTPEKVFDLLDQMIIKPNAVTLAIIFNACAQVNNDRARQIGNNLLNQMPTDFRNNAFLLTSAVSMLMRFGDVKIAEQLFEWIKKKDTVGYNAMIQGYVINDMCEQALDLFEQMPVNSDDVTYTIIFKACAQLNNDRGKNVGKKLCEQILNKSVTNQFILCSALHMLMRFGDVKSAEHLFELIKKKDIVSYNAMMKGYVENDLYKKALDLFEQMPLNPSNVTYIIIFKACAQLNNDRGKNVGEKLLGQILNKSVTDQVLLCSAIQMLMSFGDVTRAEHLFELIKEKNTVSYGAMMKGYVENDMCEKALDLFEQMSSYSNSVIHAIIFKACAQLKNDRGKNVGEKLLGQILNKSVTDQVLLSSAIQMLMSFGDVTRAEHLFELIKEKNTVSYGTMMKGYVENDMCEKALDLFEQTPVNSDVTYSIIFKACTQLKNDRGKNVGEKLLGQILNKPVTNQVVLCSAIQMLMSFGDVTRAEYSFELIKEKDAVSYNAMMNGYNLNNEPLKCLKLFEEMKQEDVVPDEITFILLIGACSQIAILPVCQSVVAKIPLHLYNEQRIGTALIDMWGKAGSVENAQQIFKTINHSDIITYNSMINAFGLNGRGSEAIDLYQQISNDLRDEVSHICVLNACSHSGLLDQGRSVFDEIKIKTERITTTMVDCFSRLFMFDEAEKLIDDFEKTNSPYLPMYMAILSGARNCRHSVLSEKIYNRMKSLFPDQKAALISGAVLLGNIYSSLGDHGRAKNIQSNRRKEFGIKIKVGLTWTEVNGEIVEFRAHDHSHPRSKEIHAEAKHMADELIEYGHKFDSTWITRPMNEDETIESVLCGHSEKLALAYNFIQRTKPSIIHMTKNLRVCGDCHQATKLIAKIRQCEIIVRDANRIHHFYPNGQCSCQDHF